MKKFLKLCLAVAALATIFGFASCSNGSSDDSNDVPATTTTTATTTVTTKTFTIEGIPYGYKTENGKVIESEIVTDTATYTITVSKDGSVIMKYGNKSVKISKDGTTITYNDGTNEYTGVLRYGVITLYDGAGNTVTAESTSETKTIAAKTTVKILKYNDTELDNKIFMYKSDGEWNYYTFKDNMCYENDSLEKAKNNFDIYGYDRIVRCNSKLYTAKIFERMNGKELYATFTYTYTGGSSDIVLNEDGTGTITFKEDGEEDSSFACTFTNNNGFVTIKANVPEMGHMSKIYAYSGKDLYEINELIFVENLNL